jgi:ferrous iron transport protein A
VNATLPKPSRAALANARLEAVPVPATLPLSRLAPGRSGVVRAVDASSPIGRRLYDLGFRPGTPLRVLRRAPLGDPTTYELRGSRFCLRRAEAERVAVEPESERIAVEPESERVAVEPEAERVVVSRDW